MVLGASEISAYRSDRFREVFGRQPPEDLQAGGEGLEVESVLGAVAFFWEWQWSSNHCAVVVVDLAFAPAVAGIVSESLMKRRFGHQPSAHSQTCNAFERRDRPQSAR